MKNRSMAHNIDIVKERVRVMLPGVKIEQLRCSHGADDDGLWFFRCAGTEREIQLESSTYNVPFLVESNESGGKQTVSTIDEAVAAVCAFFRVSDDEG